MGFHADKVGETGGKALGNLKMEASDVREEMKFVKAEHKRVTRNRAR